MTILATDTINVARERVAGNHNTPVPILVALAADSVASVRQAVSTNPNTPKKVLIQLSYDSEKAVRRVARGRLAKILRKEIEEDLER